MKTFNYKYSILNWLVVLGILVFSTGRAQDSLAAKKQYQKLVFEAQTALENANFSSAEASLRKAISINPKDPIAKYNLGVAYYKNNLNQEAMLRFKQAAGVATQKDLKRIII